MEQSAVEGAAVTALSEWARCRHWIQAAIDISLGFETIEDVEQLLADRTYQFWAGKRSAAITEIVQFKRAKVLIVRMAGGNLNELIEMEKSFCQFACAMGCTKIMGEGRRGWERVSEHMGYRFGYVVAVKDLR